MISYQGSFYIMKFLTRLNVGVFGGKWVKVKADVMNFRTLTYQSKNTGTLEEEAPKSVLYSVKLLTGK